MKTTQPDTLQQKWTEEIADATTIGDLREYYVSTIRVWTSMDAMSHPFWDNDFRIWSVSNAHRARTIELREELAGRLAVMRESRVATHA